MTSVSKLAELRAKTDRELVIVVNSELELGLRFARIVEERRSANDPDSVEPLVGAEKAYANALGLLSKVDDLDGRQRLHGKLRRLRDALDALRHEAVCSSA